jgi:hypothetical protein
MLSSDMLVNRRDTVVCNRQVDLFFATETSSFARPSLVSELRLKARYRSSIFKHALIFYCIYSLKAETERSNVATMKSYHDSCRTLSSDNYILRGFLTQSLRDVHLLKSMK